MEQLQNDYFLFSDWEGRVFKGQTESGITKLLDSRSAGKNAADIEYIPERNLLFVPTFMGNRVTCFKLSEVP